MAEEVIGGSSQPRLPLSLLWTPWVALVLSITGPLAVVLIAVRAFATAGATECMFGAILVGDSASADCNDRFVRLMVLVAVAIVAPLVGFGFSLYARQKARGAGVTGWRRTLIRVAFWMLLAQVVVIVLAYIYLRIPHASSPPGF